MERKTNRKKITHHRAKIGKYKLRWDLKVTWCPFAIFILIFEYSIADKMWLCTALHVFSLNSWIKRYVYSYIFFVHCIVISHSEFCCCSFWVLHCSPSHLILFHRGFPPPFLVFILFLVHAKQLNNSYFVRIYFRLQLWATTTQ